METVSLKLDAGFLKKIEKVMKENHYSTKTEFIREAVRDKLKEIDKTKRLKKVEEIFGKFSYMKTTDENLEKAREKAGRQIAKKFGIDLD